MFRKKVSSCFYDGVLGSRQKTTMQNNWPPPRARSPPTGSRILRKIDIMQFINLNGRHSLGTRYPKPLTREEMIL